ncbi:MAG TPA: M55 family metallopeptidase [Phycisphaerae bacterium]|nr:M55 family metallopeptidase [Phycisphaerae bacterium]
MNVLMMTDLEGVAGVVSFEPQTYSTGPENRRACSLLTAEINAAVDGLVESGAQDVLVVDSHGPGAVVFEELHPAARLLHGRPMAPRSRIVEAAAGCDVCMVIGQHAMAGAVDGDMNHTQSSRAIDSIRLNGRAIGEIAQFALQQGALGRPVVFLSGDEAACREAEALINGITTVAVKRGLGRNCAISLSAVEARRRIREGVLEAVRRHRQQPIAPLSWPGPYVLEKRFFHTDVADRAADAPGAERVDSQTVRFRGDDILEIIYR